MTDRMRALALASIAEDEAWIARHRPLIVEDEDCSSIERDIAAVQVQVDRQRALLVAL